MKNFIKYLKENQIDYKINGKKTTVLGGSVDLSSLTSMPDNVEFNNGVNVYLSSLTSMPDNVQFNNGGNVYLRSLTSMPDNVEFNNGGNVYLKNETVQINKDYLTRFGIEVK